MGRIRTTPGWRCKKKQGRTRVMSRRTRGHAVREGVEKSGRREGLQTAEVGTLVPALYIPSRVPSVYATYDAKVMFPGDTAQSVRVATAVPRRGEYA